MQDSYYHFHGVTGQSVGREVFLGFGCSSILCSVSFADVLDEETGRGYQRRLNPQHSLDFRHYARQPNSTTIPLTFNARPCSNGAWRLRKPGGLATLEISRTVRRVLARVDCQHRLGHIHDLDVQLPFMCFLGLTKREEMEIFNIINSKAKGLSASLLDYHAATLAADLATERPELFIALHLNNDQRSPWYRQLDLGGNATSGMRRRASLRTMQKATKRFLTSTKLLRSVSTETAAEIVLAFWWAVAQVLEGPWAAPRKHLLTKGVGVYTLMTIAGDLVNGQPVPSLCDRAFFVLQLSDFLPQVDWSNTGPLKGLGGEVGVKEGTALVREVRVRSTLKAVKGG